MKQLGASPRWLRGAALAPFLLIALLRCVGVVFPMAWEWSMYDIAVRHLLPAGPSTDEVVLIEIDNQTLHDLQQRWPLSRNVWTDFVHKLDSFDPAVIVLDVVFDQPNDVVCRDAMEDIRESVAAHGVSEDAAPLRLIDRLIVDLDDDRGLVQAIAAANKVVVGEMLPEHDESRDLTHQRLVGNIKAITESARDHGLLNVYRDWDGVLRRYSYVSQVDGRPRPSLALSAVTSAYPERRHEFEKRMAALDSGMPLLRFSDGIIRLRFSDVLLLPDDSAVIDKLRGRIILVGATATGVQEQHPTPVATAVPGVEIHAFAVINLLSDSHATSFGAAAWCSLLVTVLFLVMIFVATEKSSMSQLGAILMGIGLAQLALMYVFLAQAGWLLAFIPVAGGASALVFVEVLFRVRELRRHRREVAEQQRLNESKSDFIATISHELRTPLTAIRGSLGLIAGGAVGALPEQADELIHIAHNNTERLIRLVNNFLDFQKIATGKMEFHFETIELAPLLKSTVTANQAFGEPFGVAIVMDEPPDVWLVADEDLLTQAFTNLLSNAIKFSPRGDVVQVVTEIENKRVRISVIDHGPGIPEDFRHRIFTKFAQAADSTASRTKGSGLGLNIVKLIVEEHGGSVGFDTEIDQGSTFYIELPLSARRDDDSA